MRADRVENGNHARRKRSEQSRNLVNKRLGKKNRTDRCRILVDKE